MTPETLHALASPNAARRDDAFQAIRAAGKAALPALIAALEADDPLLRHEAARLVGAISQDIVRRRDAETDSPDEVALRNAFADLENPDLGVRLSALSALEKRKHPEILGRILAALHREYQKRVQNLECDQNLVLTLEAAIETAELTPDIIAHLNIDDVVGIVRLQHQLTGGRWQDDSLGAPYLNLAFARWLPQIARQRPCRELLAVLPYLYVRSLNTPMEILGIRRALERELRGVRSDLPLAAAAPETPAENLPRPAGGATSDKDLPRPAEESR